MYRSKVPEILRTTGINPIPNPDLASHHQSLGHRYLIGDEIAKSEMMAAAHIAVAVAHGAPNLKAQAHQLVARLSSQQTNTAALLATLFLAQARRGK